METLTQSIRTAAIAFLGQSLWFGTSLLAVLAFMNAQMVEWAAARPWTMFIGFFITSCAVALLWGMAEQDEPKTAGTEEKKHEMTFLAIPLSAMASTCLVIPLLTWQHTLDFIEKTGATGIQDALNFLTSTTPVQLLCITVILTSLCAGISAALPAGLASFPNRASKPETP